MTGIATAFLDSVPLVAITCNVNDDSIGRDAFQEVSITGVTLPITKHNFFVNRIENLADALRNAFRIANEGRKGPVLVDITKDVTAPNRFYDYLPQKPLPLKAHPKIDEKRSTKSSKPFRCRKNQSFILEAASQRHRQKTN